MPGYEQRAMPEFEPQEHFLRADLRLLKEAREFAERAARDFGLENGARYHVKLAMSEAVTNAIQHGSSSPDDPIRIWAAEEAGPSCSRSSTPAASGRAWPGTAIRCRTAGAGSSSCGC